MPSFQTKDREWILGIDAPLIEEIRAATCKVDGCRHRTKKDAECEAVDLASVDGKAMDVLGEDPVLLVRVLWILCREQADRHSISPADFGRSLVGESLYQATDALAGAIADFSHGPKKALVKALWAKSTKLTDIGIKKAMARVENPEFEKQIEAAMEKRMEEALMKAIGTP